MVPILVMHQETKPVGAPTPSPRQFDFWVGDWEVTTPGGKSAGINRIESLLGGKVLQEHWAGASGGSGTSLNFVDATSGQWRQIWVDGDGTTLDLRGGLVGGKMVLTGKTLIHAGTQDERITWEPKSDGSVLQTWEQSKDGGKTWSVAFAGVYTRKK